MINEDVALNGLLSGFLARKRKEKALPYIKNSKKILDVGCGLSLWGKTIKSNQQYLGIDISKSIIKKNLENNSFHNQNFQCFDFDHNDENELGNGFDLIIMLAIIEHFPNPSKSMKIIARLLKPGGKIVITTPTPYGDVILDIGAKFRIFATDKHEHNELFNYASLKAVTENANLKLRHYEKFLFFQNQFAVLEKQIDKN